MIMALGPLRRQLAGPAPVSLAPAPGHTVGVAFSINKPLDT